MKWTVYISAGLFIIILSVFADQVAAVCPANAKECCFESREENPGSIKSVMYSLSCTLRGNDGACLVIRIDLLDVRVPSNKTNMVLDIYIFNTLLGKEKTVTKRVSLSM